jgi:L-ascorbate metabolism protein UlaG (beta-lactamase superfamily)
MEIVERATDGAARIEYVGHATVLLELDGVRILTDPLLRKRIVHLRRAVALPDSTPRSLDAVLISHLHYDHLDFPSLVRLGRVPRLVVPRGAAKLIGRKVLGSPVVELGRGEAMEIGALRIRATASVHDGRRLPIGVRAESVGYVIEGSSSIYFAGDTELFPDMSELGPVDVALLPVAGWGPNVGPGHMDPLAAAEAARLLRPRVAIPIHWGTYFGLGLWKRGRTAPAAPPPEEFRLHVQELAPEIEVRVLEPGETTVVHARG